MVSLGQVEIVLSLPLGGIVICSAILLLPFLFLVTRVDRLGSGHGRAVYLGVVVVHLLKLPYLLLLFFLVELDVFVLVFAEPAELGEALGRRLDELAGMLQSLGQRMLHELLLRKPLVRVWENIRVRA